MKPGAAVNRLRQDALFDLGQRSADDELRAAHQCRLNRERQMRWRRRHQFPAPMSEGFGRALRFSRRA